MFLCPLVHTAGYRLALLHCQCFIVRMLRLFIMQELTKAITKVTDMDADMSVERIEIDPSNVAKSMTGGGNEEKIEIPTRTKKTKKKKREQVPQVA